MIVVITLLVPLSYSPLGTYAVFSAFEGIKQPKMIRPQIPEAFQKILVEFVTSFHYMWHSLTYFGYETLYETETLSRSMPHNSKEASMKFVRVIKKIKIE